MRLSAIWSLHVANREKHPGCCCLDRLSKIPSYKAEKPIGHRQQNGHQNNIDSGAELINASENFFRY